MTMFEIVIFFLGLWIHCWLFNQFPSVNHSLNSSRYSWRAKRRFNTKQRNTFSLLPGGKNEVTRSVSTYKLPRKRHSFQNKTQTRDRKTTTFIETRKASSTSWVNSTSQQTRHSHLLSNRNLCYLRDPQSRLYFIRQWSLLDNWVTEAS
jgi:hypothetical protein